LIHFVCSSKVFAQNLRNIIVFWRFQDYVLLNLNIRITERALLIGSLNRSLDSAYRAGTFVGQLDGIEPGVI